ncbi:hypothetical protein [Polynucleobacter sp. MWH-UH35A]|uniref:hypothetical protein n=1 Tax=Polynucleobacter sp. MWH-UH35A TaxID=1855619 RepID=UPI001BFE55E0|nr:hypothetical protein [Polynucleobacter sp. MWH-UH35A]QWD60370.1 hypothetical protein ICV36_01365 [Polynucleobacter sp. MWH-UH35A]
MMNTAQKNHFSDYKDSEISLMTITFETKVWENDWEIMLKTDRIRKMIERCHHSFEEKILYINNVSDLDVVKRAADRLVSEQIISKYIVVSEYAETALEFFSLSKEKMGKGYYYSIAELVSIYLTNTKHLLHFSSDSIIAPRTRKDWLTVGINTLDSNPQVKVFNLIWNKKYKEAARESEFEDQDNFYGNGFSDQMYLVRASDFKDAIYEYDHPDAARYPAYGGELFEKRVYSWLRHHNYLRATYKHGSYLHQNFSNTPWKKKVSILLNCSTLFKQ